MDSEHEFSGYREHLLNAIRTGPRRSGCGGSDPIHVFVNQRRVGLLESAGAEATLQVQSQTSVDSVQLRSEDGVLLGGLSAPEYGFRSCRIALTRAAVELRVHNTAHGGSVNAVFQPVQGFWSRARQAWSSVAGGTVPHPLTVPRTGGRALVFTQILLAVTLAGLVTDRFTGWMTPVKPPLTVTQAEVPWAAPLAEVTKLERQLVELAQMQSKAIDTIQSQQQGMAQLQRTMAKLSSTQETVASSVLTVKQEIEQRRKGAGRDTDRMTRVLMSKALSEQEQLEAEIHSLVIANERLARERAQLEQHNQELSKRLKTAGTDISKAVVPDREKPLVAQQSAPSQSPPVAEVKAVQQPPFLFWVTFSEGTSQDSIDQWVREMRGRKGALSDGWQAVEILPPTEPMERFLDQLKQAKIVKAVKVNR
ncbi:MAG: hypothetical protein Q7U39_01235 [Nitrospira sp.]|nr:hypothetical protein [Nitrospira sp.]